MHRNYVGAIERGEINPTFQTLLAVAAGLGLPLSEIVAAARIETVEQLAGVVIERLVREHFDALLHRLVWRVWRLEEQLRSDGTDAGARQ
ncbi:helix-turn-helix transcriptional regulator [Conexibacter stalactiti]|uniref:Helix-turn-helix transcriptional regulator n=1 Tax=Conexibacter stalactiti TaxID=1940611 RepID=A0ABU4HRF3_9ACTN|nr:helix-turn-helix transcriptional regulator [Conexibacter stalactiti]MDW5595115.1 helix-turn-helix transcriptional regulator [Conexibacter stalactiti]MEC5035757.1 helix-turn-helix transcriptional regulator [Conexibacter stalactiti]